MWVLFLGQLAAQPQDNGNIAVISRDEVRSRQAGEKKPQDLPRAA